MLHGSSYTSTRPKARPEQRAAAMHNHNLEAHAHTIACNHRHLSRGILQITVKLCHLCPHHRQPLAGSAVVACQLAAKAAAIKNFQKPQAIKVASDATRRP